MEKIAIKIKTKTLNTSNSDSVYLIEDRFVLEKEKIREKTDEMPVFQEMFGYLKTKGKTYHSRCNALPKDL